MWDAYCDPFHRSRESLVLNLTKSIQAVSTVSVVPLQIKFNIEVRIAIFVVHTAAFFCYLLHSVFAFRSCLIVRLYNDLTTHDALCILGGFGLGVDIGWQDAVYLAREFCGKLEGTMSLLYAYVRDVHTFFQNSSTLFWGNCFLILTGEPWTDCGASIEFSAPPASPASLMLSGYRKAKDLTVSRA